MSCFLPEIRLIGNYVYKLSLDVGESYLFVLSRCSCDGLENLSRMSPLPAEHEHCLLATQKGGAGLGAGWVLSGSERTTLCSLLTLDSFLSTALVCCTSSALSSTQTLSSCRPQQNSERPAEHQVLHFLLLHVLPEVIMRPVGIKTTFHFHSICLPYFLYYNF